MCLRLLCSAVFLLISAENALACGACISPPLNTSVDSPVLQNAERVLFLRDPVSKLSTVWVEVRYVGLAKNFAWVLPVPKLPKVGVGVAAVFDALDRQMGARMFVTALPQENCRNPWAGCAAVSHSPAGSSASDTSAAMGDTFSIDTVGPDTSNGSLVEVVASGATGPYNYTVVKGAQAQALYQWLNDNGYATPDKAKPIIASHVAKGDLFVAVKLQNGQGINAIRPITLTMDDAEPCVPLRLTAIAAQDDMTLVVTLGGPGRAIAKNHLDVQINPLRLTPFAGQPVNCSSANGPAACLVPENYAQVLATAIDEAGGNAFVTEYADQGSQTDIIDANVASAPEKLAAVRNYYQLGQQLAEQVLPVTQEVADTLDPVLGLNAYAPPATALQVLANLRGCVAYWQFIGAMGDQEKCPAGELFSATKLKKATFDSAALTEVVQKQLVEPVAAVAKLLHDSAMVTRLVMRISPAEMDRDPVFSFNPSLGKVDHLFQLKINQVCLSGWLDTLPLATRLTWPNLGSWLVDGTGTGIDPRFATTPAAARIQLLDETGAALDIAPGQASVINAAIAGAKPGQPSLPKDFVAAARLPWPVPPSDPLVTTAGPWPMPDGCVPKAGWQNGKPPANAKSDSGCGAGTRSDAVPALVLLACAMLCRRKERQYW